jgi:hypothetical protein
MWALFGRHTWHQCMGLSCCLCQVCCLPINLQGLCCIDIRTWLFISNLSLKLSTSMHDSLGWSHWWAANSEVAIYCKTVLNFISRDLHVLTSVDGYFLMRIELWRHRLPWHESCHWTKNRTFMKPDKLNLGTGDTKVQFSLLSIFWWLLQL